MTPKITPLPGEEILLVSRKLPFRFAKQILVAIGLIFVSIVLFIFSANEYFFLLAVAVLFIALILLFMVFIIWYSDVNILSNKRIVMVDKLGLWGYKISEITFSNIAATSYSQKGLVGAILNSGDLEILDRLGQKIFIRNVFNVREIHETTQIVLSRLRSK